MIGWLYVLFVYGLNTVIAVGVTAAAAQDAGGTQSISQFITLRDLATFPGQSYVVGIVSEALKRLMPTHSDGLNRALMTVGAVVVNFIASLALAPEFPETRLLMATLIMMSVLNGTAISVAAMKSIEFVVERVQREMSRDLAAGGVQVRTEVTAGRRPAAGAHAPEPSPLASIATDPVEDPKRDAP
jgi:hypothetical protein